MAQASLALPKHSTLSLWMVALVVSLSGGLVRFYFVLRADFPLNDGGLFYRMIEDLQANHYSLPRFTTYNFLDIPFAYSPLPFYLAGLLNSLFHWSLLDVLRLLPALLSTLTIPVFFYLSLELLSTHEQAILATSAYILLLPAFEWLVMGGGLTRSLATFFSLCALVLAAQAFKTNSARIAVLSGLLLGMTILSHQEIALVTVAAILLLNLFLSCCRRGWNLVGLMGVVAVMIALPYILAVARQHGLDPFTAALRAGEYEPARVISKFLSLSYTGEVYYTPFTVIAFLGVWGCLAEKKYLLPAWLVVVTFLNPRSVERTSMIPVALLIGYGLDRLILPGLARLAENVNFSINREETWAGWIRIALLGVLFFQTVSLLWLLNQNNERLAPLPAAERSAMTWVAKNTPVGGSFLVLSNSEDWASDRAAEWFPVLASRRSINTAQGLEWLPVQEFSRMRRDYIELKKCLVEDVNCLERWSSETTRPYQFVYLSKSSSEIQCGRPCRLHIEASLKESSDYRLIFENKAAAVLEKID